MALDGAKFICLSDAAAETKPSADAGKVAGNGAEATAAENIVIEAKGRKFTVGYYMSCDYVLEDPRAEGVHCEIQCDAFGRVTIHNMSEAHPISVNEQIITLKRPLLDGSRIKILDRDFLWKFPKSVEITASGSNKLTDSMINDDESTTPQKVFAAPEQAPNSCPDLKPHRKVDKRFTVHNFAYCINSDEEGNTSTDLPSITESESEEETTTNTKTTQEITEKKEGNEQTETDAKKQEMFSSNNSTQDITNVSKSSNERRSVTPEPQPHTSAAAITASTPLHTLEDTPKMNLINCTQNKENKSTEKKRRLITLCQQSDLVITSFSPRETGIRIEKSFTAIFKPIAATPKSVYSTPKSVISDYNDESSRDFIDFNTPATSKKTFGARALARNSSMHLIDLTTPNKLAPASTRPRDIALKRNQTLPIDVKLSTTPHAYGKLDDEQSEEGINALPVTPSMDLLSSAIKSDTSTPQSAELVISVDGSTDSSTAVIEISTEDTSTPSSISSPTVRTALKTTKTTPQHTTAGQNQLTSTPQRTQPTSLMKRALLTSAKKNANTTNCASPARPATTSTPARRNIKIATTTAASGAAASTPKSASRIAIGSPGNVAAAQRRSLSVKARRSLTAVESSSPSSSSTITTSTPLNARHTQSRNVPASAPRLSMVKRVSPLHGVRKSIGGITLSSHISKTRRSVVSPQKRSPTAVVVQHVSKALKTLSVANANKSQIASRSRNLVAAAVNAANNASSTGEKTKSTDASLRTPGKEGKAEVKSIDKNESADLSRTFIVDDDSLKEIDVKDQIPTDSGKTQNLTFSPIKQDSIEASKTPSAQQELNKTFSPEKPITVAGCVSQLGLEVAETNATQLPVHNINSNNIKQKNQTERISESFAEVVESNENEVETKLKEEDVAEPQQKSHDISTSALATDPSINVVPKATSNENPNTTFEVDEQQKNVICTDPVETDDSGNNKLVTTDQVETDDRENKKEDSSHQVETIDLGSETVIPTDQVETDDRENKKVIPKDQVETDDPENEKIPTVEVVGQTIDADEVSSSSALATQQDNKKIDKLLNEASDLEEDNEPKSKSESQGTADLLEEIEYVLNKSDELQQQLCKEVHNTSVPNEVVEILETEIERKSPETTMKFDNIELISAENTKQTKELMDISAKDTKSADCLPSTSTAAAETSSSTSKIIFSVIADLDEEDKTSIDSDVMPSTFDIGSSDLDAASSSIKTEILSITTISTPSEFDVSSIGGSGSGSVAETTGISCTTTIENQEGANVTLNKQMDKEKVDLKVDGSNEVSSTDFLENSKVTVVEEPESTTDDIEELHIATVECSESEEIAGDKKLTVSSKDLESATLESVEEKEEAAAEMKAPNVNEENPANLKSDIKSPTTPPQLEEQKSAAPAELNEVAQPAETIVELTVDETFAVDTKVTSFDADDIIEKSTIESEVMKVNAVESTTANTSKRNLQPEEAETAKAASVSIEAETAVDSEINSDDEKENKKITTTEVTTTTSTDIVADSKTTALEPKTPNLTGIRDMLRTPKPTDAIPTTPRSIGLRNLMRTPKATTSAAAAAASMTTPFVEDDVKNEILIKTSQRSKKNLETPQSTVEEGSIFTPRRSARRRRASANPDPTPTRCVTPTLDANSDVSTTPGRTTRRRASASAEINYTPQRITRRRSSASLDHEEDIMAVLTPQKRGVGSLRAKRTPTTSLILECPVAEDMGVIIEEEPKEDVKESNDLQQNLEAVKKGAENVELISNVSSITEVIEESICEEVSTQKMKTEEHKSSLIEENTKVQSEKQAKANNDIEHSAPTEKPMAESTDNAETAGESKIPTPLKQWKEVEQEKEEYIVVNPIIDAQELTVTTPEITEAAEEHIPQSTEEIEKTEAKIHDKSDYEYGKEVAHKSEVIVAHDEQPKTPKAQRKSVRIMEDALESPKTPVMVGMRELMKTPKASDGTPKLIGVRDLMRTPKVAISIVDDANDDERLTGLADLVKTPKVDADKRKEVAAEIIAAESDKKEDKEEEEPTTSTEARTAFIGMRELLKTPKHTSTPQYRGMRELLRTPKACSTPQLIGLEELMQTPKRTKLNDKYNDDDENEYEGLDQFFKTPRAKHIMIQGDPASAILEPSTDSSSFNIMTATTEYDLHSSNQRTLEDIYKTPVSTRLTNIDTITENDGDGSVENVGEESETIVPETPAPRNLSAEDAFDELVGLRTPLDITPPKKVYTRKCPLAVNAVTATVLSPFSAADVITDLPKTDVQEWVDKLQQSDALDEVGEEEEECEVTVSTSMLNATEATHDPIAASMCEMSNVTLNKDTTEELLADMSAITTSEDPLLPSATKYAESEHHTAGDNENETLRPGTPIDSEISGINLLDQTNESIFSEPLMVSDIESIHDSLENVVIEEEGKDTPEEESSERQRKMSEDADNKSQEEEDFPVMFVESSDSEQEENADVTKTATNTTHTAASTTTPAHKVTDTHDKTITENKKDTEVALGEVSAFIDLDDSSTSESVKSISLTTNSNAKAPSNKVTDIHIEFSNFQAHKTIASQKMRASTPNRSTKARTTQYAQVGRRQSMGAEKLLAGVTIDLTHEKTLFIKEKERRQAAIRDADCIIEVDESIEEVISVENVTKDDEKAAELNENTAKWTTASRDIPAMAVEEVHKEFSNFQAHKTIASREKRAATPDQINKRNANAQKISQAPRRLTLGAEQHLKEVSFDFSKEKSKLQQSKQLTKHIVEIVQEIDDSIDECADEVATQSKQNYIDTVESTENAFEVTNTNVELDDNVENVKGIEEEHAEEPIELAEAAVELKSKAENSGKITATTSDDLQKRADATISISTVEISSVVEEFSDKQKTEEKSDCSSTTTKGDIEKQTKLAENKIEKVDENHTPEDPTEKEIESASQTEIALITEPTTAQNDSIAAGDNKMLNTREDQEKPSQAKTEFNECDIFDLTEEPTKDPPEMNTTQGVIFDLTEGEGEEKDAGMKNVQNNEESNSSEVIYVPNEEIKEVTIEGKTTLQQIEHNIMKADEIETDITKQNTKSSNEIRTESQCNVISSTENGIATPTVELESNAEEHATIATVAPVEDGNNEVKADSTNKMEELPNEDNNTKICEQLKAPVHAEEDNIEICESVAETSKAKVEITKQITLETLSKSNSVEDVTEVEEVIAPSPPAPLEVDAGSNLSKKENESVKITDEPPALLLQDSANELVDSDLEEITEEPIKAAANEANAAVGATLKSSKDNCVAQENENEGDNTAKNHDKTNKQKNIIENSLSGIEGGDLQETHAASSSEKLSNEEPTNEEQTNKVIATNTQQSTKDATQVAVVESLEIQSNTENVVNTEETAEVSVVTGKHNEEVQEVHMQQIPIQLTEHINEPEELNKETTCSTNKQAPAKRNQRKPSHSKQINVENDKPLCETPMESEILVVKDGKKPHLDATTNKLVEEQQETEKETQEVIATMVRVPEQNQKQQETIATVISETKVPKETIAKNDRELATQQIIVANIEHIVDNEEEVANKVLRKEMSVGSKPCKSSSASAIIEEQSIAVNVKTIIENENLIDISETNLIAVEEENVMHHSVEAPLPIKDSQESTETSTDIISISEELTASSNEGASIEEKVIAKPEEEHASTAEVSSIVEEAAANSEEKPASSTEVASFLEEVTATSEEEPASSSMMVSIVKMATAKPEEKPASSADVASVVEDAAAKPEEKPASSAEETSIVEGETAKPEEKPASSAEVDSIVVEKDTKSEEKHVSSAVTTSIVYEATARPEENSAKPEEKPASSEEVVSILEEADTNSEEKPAVSAEVVSIVEEATAMSEEPLASHPPTEDNVEKLDDKAITSSSTVEKEQPAKRSKRKTSRSKQNADENKEINSKKPIESEVIVEQPELAEEKSIAITTKESATKKSAEETKLENDRDKNQKETEKTNQGISKVSTQTVEVAEEQNEATTSHSKQTPEEKREGDKKATSELETSKQTPEEKGDDVKKANIESKTSLDKSMAVEEKEAIVEKSGQENSNEHFIRENEMKNNAEEKKREAESEKEAENIKTSETLNEEISEIETQSVKVVADVNEATSSVENQRPSKRKVRKPSRSKQTHEEKDEGDKKTTSETEALGEKSTIIEAKQTLEENVEDVIENKEVDKNVEEEESKATANDEKQHPAKRSVRKTSRSKRKAEQNEGETSCKAATDDEGEKLQSETVKESPIEGTASVEIITILDDDEYEQEKGKIAIEETSKPLTKDVSESTTVAIEESVEATTSMPAKRKGRKPSRTKQNVKEKLDSENKLIVEESELNTEQANVEDVVVAESLHVKATFEVCLSTSTASAAAADKHVEPEKREKSEIDKLESGDDKSKIATDQETATILKTHEKTESTDNANKHEEQEEAHTQRLTRRTRKGSASSQCSAQDEDHLPTTTTATTKRRGGRRRAETPIEHSADEASTHDEAPTTTKRRRGQAKATEVTTHLEEIKEVLLDDSKQLKEQNDECEKKTSKDINADVENNKIHDKKETPKEKECDENGAQGSTVSPASEQKNEQLSDDNVHATSEVTTVVELEKDALVTKEEAKTCTVTKTTTTEITDDIKKVEATADATDTRTVEEVKGEKSHESTNSRAPRRGGRRKPTVSESSQTSNTAEHIEAHATQRSRRRRKPTTEDTVNESAAAVVETSESKIVLAEETQATEEECNEKRDVKVIKTEIKNETDEELHASSSATAKATERALKEEKEISTEIPTINIDSSEESCGLKSESQKENIAVQEEQPKKEEEATTMTRKRVNRRKKTTDSSTEEHQQTENADEIHKGGEETARAAETHKTHTKKVDTTEEPTNTVAIAESVGGRRGRRGAAAAATVAINEFTSAHKRGTPRGKTQLIKSQTQTAQREMETKKNTTNNEALTTTTTSHDDEEPPTASQQKVVRRKRRGSVTDVKTTQPEKESAEKEHETEDESTRTQKVVKRVRKRLAAEESQAEDKHEEEEGRASSALTESPSVAATTASVSSTVQQRSRRKRKNSLQSVDGEVAALVGDVGAGGANANEPPKKRSLSRKRRDSSLDSSIHEGAAAAAEGDTSKASGGNTSSASTTPQRSRNVPRRAVAAQELNYDESSDAEAQVDLKRRIEKASLPKASSSGSAAATTKTKQQRSPTTAGAGTSSAEAAITTTTTSETEVTTKTASSTPILSAVLTTSRGGRQRKPTARVQQYLEEERAKAETPKKRLLLSCLTAAAGGGGGGGETPTTSHTRSTPATRRTRKTSAVEVEVMQTPARGRARTPKVLTTTTIETSEESRSETEHTHSELEETSQATVSSHTLVEEKEKEKAPTGKRTTTRRGKQTASATAQTESELSETQEVHTSRSGRAAKAAAAAALIPDEPSTGSHTKSRGGRARRGAHVTAADDEQPIDVKTKEERVEIATPTVDVDEKTNKKTTKATTSGGASERAGRAGRGGRRNKQQENLLEDSETSSTSGAQQQTIVIDADDEHEEEDDEDGVAEEEEEEDKPLAKVKKIEKATTAATKKRTAKVASAVSVTESPVPKRVRRRGGAAGGDGGEMGDDADATHTDGNSRSRKVVRFNAATSSSASAASSSATAQTEDTQTATAVTTAPATRATRSRRK